MPHVEQLQKNLENLLIRLNSEQIGLSKTPSTSSRSCPLCAAQHAELQGRIDITQIGIENIKRQIDVARNEPHEIIIQEEPILDVPIEERFIPITPSNGQNNTLRNALIVGGALLLII